MLVHLGMTGKFFFINRNAKKFKTSFYYNIDENKDNKHNKEKRKDKYSCPIVDSRPLLSDRRIRREKGYASYGIRGVNVISGRARGYRGTGRGTGRGIGRGIGSSIAANIIRPRPPSQLQSHNTSGVCFLIFTFFVVVVVVVVFLFVEFAEWSQ